MAEKAPAFQFYPRDYMTDPHVLAMTWEQRGLYWHLCSICWLEGSLPHDMGALARLLGMPTRRFARAWDGIRECFEATDDGARLRHPRLDRERDKQMQSRERRQAAADKRWRAEQSNADALHTQSTCEADAKQCSSSSSASSSASATAVSTETSAVPLTAGLPAHRSHAACGRVCLPAFVFEDFVRKRGGDEADAGAYVRAWYRRRVDALPAEAVVGDDDVRLLKAWWAADHPSVAPKAASFADQRAARRAAFLAGSAS